MFNKSSPLKRKHSEFHDPDYPQQDHIIEEDDDAKPGCSSQYGNKKIKFEKEHNAKNVRQNGNYFDRVRQIIEREFQREIATKQQQLEEIDERLEKAKHLLERLRYGIVSDYYKKQEIPLTAADAATLKGNYSLFDRVDRGPQMPIHPSVKKLIGKRPKDLNEVIRACPKRTAAQNAVQTIRAKSQAQKREERKLKQIIKEQGIVIDHSKQTSLETNVNALLNTAAQNSLKNLNNSGKVKQEKVFKEPTNKSSGKSLNSARLNNKIKHLIVVGNTSKYIGNEIDRDVKSHTQTLTHKWLVYVQPKDTKLPIERFIKKVRFHLHRSYRPNDVVDIEAPPFQVSRRGWGEFPIRVQLFFHSEFHQKPVQLIHNIVLDQTLSGIQTLGAETLLEIWLREVKFKRSIGKEIKETKTAQLEEVKKLASPTKPKNNIITANEELVDDNLLDFLNKIEASPCSISADIEKIQPTVLVSETMGVKMKTPSPVKNRQLAPALTKTPTKIVNIEERLKIHENALENASTSINNSHVTKPQQSITTIITTTPKVTATCTVATTPHIKTGILNNGFLATKPIITSVNLRMQTSPAQVKLINTVSTVASHNTQMPTYRPITSVTAQSATLKPAPPVTTQKPSIILNKEGKIMMPSASVASAVRKTILPIVSNTSNVSQTVLTNNKVQVISTPSSSSTPASTTFSAPKQILQKKLVQLVDSTGKVKYIQMLVAASSASSSVQNLNKSPVAPKLITMAPSLGKNKTVTNTTHITNTVTTPILRTPNGIALMPAMTTKPNIFKIVPESMQTKPQIITFNTTTGTTFTNTILTTTSKQQQMQHLKTPSAQPPKPFITTSLGAATTTKSVNTTILQANKLQKSSISNAIIPTKNLVFQKEGKVYIIDPQQMKYKQQQKKQVSLLKPQISLLKQQQQQKQITETSTSNNSQPLSPSSKTVKTNVPPIHFGLKQQRINSINALQLIQMKRMLFEKQFLRLEFTNVRSAVEFLLRRLQLIVPKDSLVADFPFVSHSLHEFYSLTAFKQRAYEWLRAKNICRLLRSHKDLQHLNNSSKEIFWSTKEIAIFARQYAYTPPIKSLPKPGEQQQDEEQNNKAFTDLVKSELKQEKELHYDTLTEHYKVRNWIEKVWHNLKEYELHENQHQIIDIDSIEEEEDNKKHKSIGTLSHTSSSLSNTSGNTYLTTPLYLENECQLVNDICKNFNTKLDYEELDTNIYHPSAQTALAHCLHLFIEKLLRQTLALKQNKSSLSSSTAIESFGTLMPQDFAKVLASNSEFDFITNNNFGSALLAAECLEVTAKQEKP